MNRPDAGRPRRGARTLVPARPPSKVQELAGSTCTWIDVERPAQKDMEALSARYGLHPLEIEDVLSTRQRNKIERHKDHLFIILRFPYFVEGTHARRQVSFFLGKDYLITAHDGDLKSVAEVLAAARADPTMLERGPSFLVYRLVDALVDSLFPLLDAQAEQLDDLEEAVYDEATEAIAAVTALRRKTHFLRTSVAPLKRVIAELSNELVGRDKDLSVYLKDVNDHVEKVFEKLDETKETIEIYKDTDFLLSTARTNRILAVLTIAFTLAIPATVVGTFYGMNVNIPGGNAAGAWDFFGPYTTFILVLLFSLVLPSVLMLWLFRRLHWV